MTRFGKFFLFSIYKTDDIEDAMMYQSDLKYAYNEGYHEAYWEILKQVRACNGINFCPTFKRPRSRFERCIKNLEKVFRRTK